MTSEEFKDAQMIFRYAYAWESFRRAKAACEHVMDTILKETPRDALIDNSVYVTLMVGIYTLYARPFCQALGLKKSHGIIEQIIPKNMMDTHNEIMTLRHKFFAHTDADEHPEDSNSVDFLVNQDGLRITYVMRLPLHVEVEKVYELLTELERKCYYHLERLTPKHQKKIPGKHGLYTLNVRDENGSFVERKNTVTRSNI